MVETSTFVATNSVLAKTDDTASKSLASGFDGTNPLLVKTDAV
jgi:hypothetical protein